MTPMETEYLRMVPSIKKYPGWASILGLSNDQSALGLEISQHLSTWPQLGRGDIQRRS